MLKIKLVNPVFFYQNWTAQKEQRRQVEFCKCRVTEQWEPLAQNNLGA
jgi:hypothetical protein